MREELGETASLVDLEAVEVASRFKHWTLRFPPRIEARFRADIGAAGSRRLAAGMIWVIVTYNALLFADALLIPDILPLSVVLHLGVTALLLNLIWLLRHFPTNRARVVSLIATVALLGAQFESSLLLSASPNVNHYQYLLLMLIPFGNNILRPPFPIAIAMTVLVGVGHVALMFAQPLMTGPAIGMMMVMLIGAAYITLVGNYQAERQTRRSYLRRLRDEIAAAQLSRDNVKLTRMAQVDPLTSLDNRRGLEAQVEDLLQDPARRNQCFALLVMDVDHFKAFNDRHGHAEGDRCLKAIAEAARAELRSDDAFLGRVGGEEFVALLPGADLERGRCVAERLREAVARLAVSHGASANGIVTVSIGVAEEQLTGQDAVASAFERADAALYVAKWCGRNRVHAGPLPASPTGRARSAA